MASFDKPQTSKAWVAAKPFVNGGVSGMLVCHPARGYCQGYQPSVKDCFVDEIPKELPPSRGEDDHKIDVVPGSSPPNRPPYRVSCVQQDAQQEEILRQVNELLEKGFGTPLEIISDKGPGFRGDLVGDLMEQLGISRRHSSPYYPQCNGLVETVNGMICRIITKQANNRPKDWDRHLNAALWAYRTSFKTNLGYTAYQLVFGKEAILPIEVQLTSLRVLESGKDRPSEQLRSRI
ncbi:hypothetical protein L7F22_059949 [Adiantum nelumboides]|nr:hypothetical protein [Adiantum nelumboides]